MNLAKPVVLKKFEYVKNAIWCDEFYPDDDDLFIEVKKVPQYEASLVYYLEHLTYWAMPLTIGRWIIPLKKARRSQISIEALVDIDPGDIEIYW